ncbi:MAG: hypothetical protein ACLRWQ_09475 [Flavonifractor plautii]
MTFNEITKKVVNDSIAHPRAIDHGSGGRPAGPAHAGPYRGLSELSPLLWKKIRRGLSAGRVSRLATCWCASRRRRSRPSSPRSTGPWTWTSPASPPTLGQFKRQPSTAGRKKQELRSEAEVNAVVDAVKAAPFAGHRRQAAGQDPVSGAPSSPPPSSRRPAELNMTPGRHVHRPASSMRAWTSRRAAVVITCMRTDSLRLSERGHRRRQGINLAATARTTIPARPGSTRQIRRPGRPRGHPALQREPDPGGHQEVPHRRAV